ncbi:MAG: tRNA (5-methylaminomethyl-2-thiouridine)(34)-methyltransferase MnmD [Pseudomonadota bacterium]
MSDPTTTGGQADITWGDDGVPRARGVDDVYFSAIDGRAETAHVFLGGNGLPERWNGRDGFAIAELGFGLGLNLCETWRLFEATAPVKSLLAYTSFEIAPPRAEDIARALAPWPDLRPYADALCAAWRPEPGWNRWRLGRLDLTLAIGDARALVPDWSGTVDAWYLDGFSPAKNPSLWEAPLLAEVGQRTAPGGTAATYSAAGAVRRALQAAGFAVTKAQGFAHKREMIVATMPAEMQTGITA